MIGLRANSSGGSNSSATNTKARPVSNMSKPQPYGKSKLYLKSINEKLNNATNNIFKL